MKKNSIYLNNLTLFSILSILSQSAQSASSAQKIQSVQSVPNTQSADSASTLARWTYVGPGGSFFVRAVTNASQCPTLTVDTRAVEMLARPAFAPLLFPVTTCEASIPKNAQKIEVGGEIVPAPVVHPKRIVILGDTGCRIKKVLGQTIVQACNDPAQWPFARISQAAAQWNPDLVIHVGDYHYREAECPENVKECQGSVEGDRWASWKQDFFDPAASLLRAAPWIFVRGNHEECERAGQGWFQLLEPRANLSECSDKMPSYRIPFPGFSLAVVDAAKRANMQSNLNELAKHPEAGEWILLHRPLLTLGADEEGKKSTTFPRALGLPGRVGLVFAGHQHLSSLNQFAHLPPELISGNGGTQLLKKIPSSSQVSPLSNISSAHVFLDFGFLTLESTTGSLSSSSKDWILSVRNVRGEEVTRCQLTQVEGKRVRLNCQQI